MPYQKILQWGTLNTLSDERYLKPNSDKETIAESPDMENVELTLNGSIATSPGFEEVSSRGSGSGRVKNILPYNKDDDTQYLLIAHDDDYFSITPANTSWSNTNLGDYGTAATNVGGTVYKGSATAATATVTITSYANLVSGTDDAIVVNGVTFTAQAGAATPGDATFRAATSNDATATSLRTQVNAYTGVLTENLDDITASEASAVVTLTADTAGGRGNTYKLAYIDNDTNIGAVISGALFTGGEDARQAILGNDNASNYIQKADVSSAMTTIGGAPAQGYIMESFMGHLFIARDKTLYYSNIEDEDDWSGGGTIGFNDVITGLMVEGTRLVVFTRSYHQGVFFQYDDSNVLSVPLKEPYERQYGCLAPKTVVEVYPDTYYWSPFGAMRLGTESGYDENGLPRPMSLSTLIDPSLQNTNFAERALAASIFNPAKQQYYLSVPNGVDTFNSVTYVYNRNWNAWTKMTGFYPSCWALFKNTYYEDEQYFGDENAPRVLKFNDQYTFAGSGYTRKWKSKKFIMGDANRMKQWKWVDIAGSMYENTEFTVTMTVDGESKSYIIDSTHLETAAGGGYLGDNWLGDQWKGGELVTSQFKRFRARIYFDQTIKEGFDMQITVQNDGAGQPWKLDFMGIEYEYLARHQLANKFINDNPTT